jgi:GTP-binding protein EngB required for normal cell division
LPQLGGRRLRLSVPGKRPPTVSQSGRITIVGRSNAGKSALFNPQ